MKVEGGKKATEIANKQFKIIGEDISFSDIPDDEIIVISNKKVKWYDYYLFTEEQQEEWRNWYREEIEREIYPVDMFMIEMVYGFRIKKGEL